MTTSEFQLITEEIWFGEICLVHLERLEQTASIDGQIYFTIPKNEGHCVGDNMISRINTAVNFSSLIAKSMPVLVNFIFTSI